MKTSNFILRSLKAMNAFIIAATLSTSFTSCGEISDEASHIIDAENEKATQYLLGSWYAGYEAIGATRAYDSQDSITVDFTFVVDVYEMKLNGAGYWTRYYFNNDSAMPVCKKGGEKEGMFKYIAMEGNGAFNLYNDSEFYDSRAFKYDEKSIRTKGEDNMEYTFSKLSSSDKSDIELWEKFLK